MFRAAFLLLLPLSVASVLATATSADDVVAHARARIRGTAIRDHVAVLADDRLQGRGTGTPGYQQASHYVAARFRAIGLQPGASDTSFFQPVPFRRAEVMERECSLGFTPEGGQEHRFEYGRDYVMSPDYLHDDWTAANRISFVGYGITAPELGWDDYAGINVRGRIVVQLSGAPKSFPHDQRAYYSWSRGKESNAAAHAARGIITVRTPQDEGRATWERVLRQSRLPGMRWIGSDNAPNATFEMLHLGATLTRAAAETLFATSGWRLDSVFALADAGRVPHFHLAPQLHLRRVTLLSSASSPNVIGLLRGSDPTLRDQYLVYTAHLDHLGLSTPVQRDSINNGAYDNASGVAMMIEIARAFATLTPRPRRSILFVAVCGEEKGLQGSDYFVHHLPVPAGSIVADINLDMFLMLHAAHRVVAIGAEHSSLGATAGRAAAALGIGLAPDPDPEEVVFVRSDQFSFIRAGIPALFPTASRGETPADSAATRQWLRTIYHSPQDDLHQRFDWEAGATCARFAFLMGSEVANQAAPPTWTTGDFFGATFAKP